jgi:hypothetical protein
MKMSGFTNKGKFQILDIALRGATPPANFKLALCTSANVPTADTNLLTDLTEIAAGNGYAAGGQAAARNSTDFDLLSEDDTLDISKLQLKDLSWTATGGSIPASGAGARYAVLTNLVGEVLFYWDLQSDRSVSDTQSLTAKDLEIQLTE